MQLFRRLDYGGLVSSHVLDTRRYRSQSESSESEDNNVARWDPSRTLLGAQQEKWLMDGMTGSSAAWNVLANQVRAGEIDRRVGDGERYSAGTWDGYAAFRAELFNTVHERDIDNMVIVTGGAHYNSASDLKPHFKDETSPVVGAEFSGTSVAADVEAGRPGIAQIGDVTAA